MLDLPGELVEEILCRVPATSLTRLRYTCKRWNSLFNKRRFIRKHKDKAAKQCFVLMLKQSRVCLMSVNFYRNPSIEVKAEYSLLDPQASLDEFKIYKVYHCDGLLLCNNREYNRIVVWNPCTGQTKWIRIQPRKIGYYALGCYQDNKYDDKSYKILCCYHGYKFEIYEINSSLWRTLDVTLDCELEYDASLGTSVKGKTYWCASDKKEKQLGMFLVSFDYTTERFERLLLPCHCPYYHRILSLSVVRDEKLSVLLELENTSRKEIWVTNKIDESTKVVSWTKVLTVDLKPEEICIWNVVSFLVDEEKKFLLSTHVELGDPIKEIVYIVGEDNRAKQELSECTSSWPFLFHYVPSLTQIQM